MDIYNNAPNYTYITGITKPFRMPTNSGGIPAVAVPKKTAEYINSAYTILTILIFMIGWNLILAIIMAFWPTRGDPNRRTALVALLNSGESMNAVKLMVSYCNKARRYMRESKRNEASPDLDSERAQSHPPVTGEGQKSDSNIRGLSNEGAPATQEKQNGTPDGYPDSNPKDGVRNLLWGLLFVFLAFTIAAGNAVAGILVPAQLSMGSVAPAAKDAIYYPNISYYDNQNDTGDGYAKVDALIVPSALRALGVVEGSTTTVLKELNKRAKVHSQQVGDSARLSYTYDVTAADMGLLNNPKLKLIVNGSCRTEDTWLVNSTDEGDTYRPFGGNNTFEVKYQDGRNTPPLVNFVIDEDTFEVSNASYAMIVNTAGFNSSTPSDDPWYMTDKIGNGSSAYRVRRGRPALSCWEARTWHLNGKDVDSENLSKLPGLKLHKFWTETVFPVEFGIPLVIILGTAVGSSALRSASYASAPDFTLDANASAVIDDMWRLVWASSVRSRNVVRDTISFPSEFVVNLAKGPGGIDEAGPAGSAADFVVQSKDVVTLSVRILIAVPTILLFLFIVKKTLDYRLPGSRFGQDPIILGEKENRTSLMAAQLYRGLDQRMGSRNWKHTDSLVPFAYPPEIEGSIANNQA